MRNVPDVAARRGRSSLGMTVKVHGYIRARPSRRVLQTSSDGRRLVGSGCTVDLEVMPRDERPYERPSGTSA